MNDPHRRSAISNDTGKSDYTGLGIAVLSLLGAGTLLGVSTNIAKVAASYEMAPAAFLFWSVLGAALILILAETVRGRLPDLNLELLAYWLVAAFFTVVGSNLIFFAAVTHVGVGFVVLALCLPPTMTYIVALFLKMERPCRIRMTGILFAFAGSGYIALQKLKLSDANSIWIALTLFGPVLLAAGNIYRSRFWPKGLDAEQLAPGMLLASATLLAAFALLPNVSLAVPNPNMSQIALITLQAIVFAGQFTLVFVLQKFGGPVLLSLFGSVAAIVGIPIAWVVLGEALPDGLAFGSVGLVIGVTLLAYGHTRAHQLRRGL